MSSGAGKTVCVTGANGYIASWVVKYLLDRGYTVNATVRDLSDPTKTAHLVGLDGAADRLHLFTANLLEEGSFDAAIKGCEGVFHVASPFFYQETPDPKADLFDPAEKGTLNVLNSVVKASTVKRVVLTSSIATVAFNEKPLTLDTLVDETWFASRALHTEKKQWYDLSKILAEDAAVAFAKEKGLDLVILNPALVIGPLLQPTLNTSAEVILNLINGTQTTYPNAAYGYVNVKDVAHAHVQAFEIPSASGRYLLVESVVPFKNVVQLLHDFYPTLKQLPDKPADDKPFVHGFKVCKEKAKTLGIEFTPFEQSLKETVESLKEKKFISI